MHETWSDCGQCLEAKSGLPCRGRWGWGLTGRVLGTPGPRLAQHCRAKASATEGVSNICSAGGDPGRGF